jgi:hypothetical protein
VINLDRLLTWLNQSDLQTKNQPLYQVIKTLIQAAQEFQNEQDTINTASSGILNNASFLTVNNELASLPFSRREEAGVGIAFDDSIFGIRTISATSVVPSGYWTLLTDGDPDETDFIFANGDAISIFVPV